MNVLLLCIIIVATASSLPENHILARRGHLPQDVPVAQKIPEYACAYGLRKTCCTNMIDEEGGIAVGCYDFSRLQTFKIFDYVCYQQGKYRLYCCKAIELHPRFPGLDKGRGCRSPEASQEETPTDSSIIEQVRGGIDRAREEIQKIYAPSQPKVPSSQEECPVPGNNEKRSSDAFTDLQLPTEVSASSHREDSNGYCKDQGNAGDSMPGQALELGVLPSDLQANGGQDSLFPDIRTEANAGKNWDDLLGNSGDNLLDQFGPETDMSPLIQASADNIIPQQSAGYGPLDQPVAASDTQTGIEATPGDSI